MAPEHAYGAEGVRPAADVARSRTVSLEKRSTEQFKHASTPGLDGCIRGAVFRRYVPTALDWDRVQRGAREGVVISGGHYEVVPFRCGSWSCPGCAADRAQAVRAGIREAVAVHGLHELVTLTLQDQDADLSPTDSRTKISRMWNAFATRLRRTAICAVSRCRTVWSMGRGRDNCPACGSPIFVRFLTEYVAVDEEHKTGVAHKHIAANLDGLLMSVRNDYGAAQAALSEAWGALGGGFVDFHAGRGQSNAAGYLTKYIAKSQLKAPRWTEVRWCTEDNSFRSRPWHRFSASRLAGRTIAGPRPEGQPWSGLFPWKLCREEARPGGRMTYASWSPAKGSAIVPECDGHPIAPEWICRPCGGAGTMEKEICAWCGGSGMMGWRPGLCHHDGGPSVRLGDGGPILDPGRCGCVPPWAAEVEWETLSPQLAALVAWDESEQLCASGCTCDRHRPRELREDAGRWFRFGPGGRWD